jgi:hypothetical protein
VYDGNHASKVVAVAPGGIASAALPGLSSVPTLIAIPHRTPARAIIVGADANKQGSFVVVTYMGGQWQVGPTQPLPIGIGVAVQDWAVKEAADDGSSLSVFIYTYRQSISLLRFDLGP